MTSTLVLPGQPLHVAQPGTSSATTAAGRGAFIRGSTVYSSSVGLLERNGGQFGVASLQQRADDEAILGIVTRLTRLQAVLNIISVDGKQCQQDWQGIIRTADIRQTDKDKMKIWDCFRPGDVVRAVVISLGDVRSYYLSTAKSDLGVVFAKHSETGSRLEAIGWNEMRDPTTGQAEPRKVAGPAT
ncbi:hypothetical protein EMMF5_001773 [Cystobasidiomycetes sp. EMM_F5]